MLKAEYSGSVFSWDMIQKITKLKEKKCIDIASAKAGVKNSNLLNTCLLLIATYVL